MQILTRINTTSRMTNWSHDLCDDILNMTLSIVWELGIQCGYPMDHFILMSGSLNSQTNHLSKLHNLNSMIGHLIAAHTNHENLFPHYCLTTKWSSKSKDTPLLMVSKPDYCLPPGGHTFPVLLVRDPKDPSRHSEVVRSFWVAVGSSFSKPAFWW